MEAICKDGRKKIGKAKKQKTIFLNTYPTSAITGGI